MLPKPNEDDTIKLEMNNNKVPEELAIMIHALK